jgi:precorrin-2/cobalt-factor-2 C20-methyltransferase
MPAGVTGAVYGIGVGPGDPELLTLKAVRFIETTPVVAYLASRAGHSQAREIAAQWLGGQREIPIPVSCQTDRRQANRAYDQAATMLGEILDAGQDVAILCEGDPLFYGSFSYLFQRLSERFRCTVIPGISSISAVAAVTGRPLVTGNDRLVVIPGTASPQALRRALTDYDSVAIMKPGRHRPRILQLLRETGRMADAVYVERATRQTQRIVSRVEALEATPGPYFALFLVTRPSEA